MTVVAVDVFTVTTTSDTDTNPGNDLTLSEAIADANSNSNPVLIDFAPDVLAAGTYTLTGDLPAITAANVTIEGGGLTLDAAGHRGLFVSSGNVTIDDLIIANAKAAGAAGQNALSGGGGGGGGGAAGLGGGLFVGKDANVTLSDVAFQNDSATGGAGGTGVLPVCIKAGALGDNVPARDLWISPNHAMYSRRGVLIEAKDLLNGISIVQAQAVETLEYFHIELDSHDVIIAEGALSESFIDDDNRGMFHNAHEYETLYSASTRRLRPIARRASTKATRSKRCGSVSQHAPVSRALPARRGSARCTVMSTAFGLPPFSAGRRMAMRRKLRSASTFSRTEN